MKIVAIGDSITYGHNVRADQAWPAVLARQTGHDVRNEGVCGDTTRLGLERFPKAVQLHRPDVVVIQFGHNDANEWGSDNGLARVSRDAYVANIKEMFARATSSGAKRVIVLRPHQAPGRDSQYATRLLWYAAGLGSYAVPAPEVSVLDDGYGLHPDPAMHRRYALLVAANLDPAKASPSRDEYAAHAFGLKLTP